MATVNASEKETWHEGDRCLAPDPGDGTLKEATIQRLTTSPNNETIAWVLLRDISKDGEEEKAVPVSKLTRSTSNHFLQEKPVFPGSTLDPRLCVPLELSDADGDRVPYTINRYLRDYQRKGVSFLYNNYICSRGCILGDDMGLGKTVQVIAFLAAVLNKTGTWEDIQKNRPQFLQSQMSFKQSKPNKLFLIVAPLSVLYNWKDELDIWGHFQCVVVHGLRKEEELARIKNGRIEIALTTYETLRLRLDEFNKIDWSAVVVDEAHKIKNPNSQITEAMKDLRCQVRIGLTGTILQNNLEELWCVMDWAVPGCLGSLGNFKNRFSDPIEQGQKHSATKRVLATGRKAVKALVRKISRWFLRRTKALIKEQLPKKDDRVVFCSLTDFQQSVYQTVLDTEDVTLLLRSSEKCDCQSGRTRRGCCYKTNSEGVKIKELYFIYLAILRKAANHLALLQSTAGTSRKQEKYVGAVCANVFQKFPDFVQRCKDESFEALSDPVYSGKMKVLQKLLKFYLQKRDKVLLFSPSTKLLDVLENYCMAEGLDYSRLDGTTKAKERIQIVKEFNGSSHVNLCLVSTMAGGLGLNFVGANVVVLFDPTWNPANDLQAIDRAYRIGQCRDVTVLRLISLGTVEEIIYLRQIYKQQLQCTVVGEESSRRYFEAVQGHGNTKGELFGIKNLFRLQTQGTCLTHKILEREGQVEAGVMTASAHRGDEKEEETKGEAGECPLKDGPVPDDDLARKARDASQVPRGLLDFSSGSEEDEDEQRFKRKMSKPGAGVGNRGENVATSSGHLSLFQHGFSKLLENVQRNPELGDEDSSPGADESPSEEDARDQNKGGTFSGVCRSGNDVNRLSKLETKTHDISSCSDREDLENKETGRIEKVSLIKQSDDAIRERQSSKGWTDKKTPEDEESDEGSSPDKEEPVKLNRTVLKEPRLEIYSDESEDLDVAILTRPKKNISDSHSKGGKERRERVDCSRKRRKSASVRDKVRSKFSEDIEAFTSSEDEHTPFKKGRPPSPKCGQRAGTTGRQAEMARPVSFTGLKRQTSPAVKGKDGTIDSVLGGVPGVMYTHSNQRVVGGSRAEELISRVAVRDVFERKMYSQLPANHVLDNIESLTASPPDSQPGPSGIRPGKPTVDYPATFTNKSMHQTRHTTFIIGETPRAICRQQLEEMAERFNFPSVRQFAVEILRRDSAQRLAWLRQYYASLNHPDLSTTVTNNFPQPDSAPTSSSSASTKTATTECHTRTRQKDFLKAQKNPKCTQKRFEPKTKPETPQNNVSLPQEKPRNPQNYVQKPHKNLKIPQKNILQPPSDVPSLESEGQEEMVFSARGHKRTKRGSVSGAGASRAAGGLGLNQASSSGLGSGEAAAPLNCTDRDSPSSPDLGLSHGTSTMLSKPTAEGREREPELSSRTSESFQGPGENPQASSPPERATPTSNHRSFLSQLIGDTSILDDLLKPKSKGGPRTLSPDQPSDKTSLPNMGCGSTDLLDTLSSPKANTQAAQQAPTKGSRKDIWDILNEGNEESINKLTDPAEVQRVCINTSFAAGSRSKKAESTSLWKTNEKFLWKK